jgi:CBS domain-containing protein
LGYRPSQIGGSYGVEAGLFKKSTNQYKYSAFPVVQNQNIGVVTCQDILAALEERHLPPIYPFSVCYPNETVREVANKFLESPVNFLPIVSPETGRVVGIFILHDLIRAQAGNQG